MEHCLGYCDYRLFAFLARLVVLDVLENWNVTLARMNVHVTWVLDSMLGIIGSVVDEVRVDMPDLLVAMEAFCVLSVGHHQVLLRWMPFSSSLRFNIPDLLLPVVH